MALSESCIFFSVGRGGQSALRFARLRMEKRHNYVRKVAETAVQLFISNDRVSNKHNGEVIILYHLHSTKLLFFFFTQPNITGLILAGSADFKTELSQSDMFDQVSDSVLRC